MRIPATAVGGTEDELEGGEVLESVDLQGEVSMEATAIPGSHEWAGVGEGEGAPFCSAEGETG